MDNIIHETLDKWFPEIIPLSEDIYRHPELGFREFKTREKYKIFQ
jgi:metal-dependent amidase/aminoacylase/carboxypeptidase family protein